MGLSITAYNELLDYSQVHLWEKTVVKNENAKLKFLYRKGALFGVTERRELYTVLLLQPHFDYVCNAW